MSNLEIVFCQQKINKPFHFALFVKNEWKLFSIVRIFLYLCSHEKKSDHSIISIAHNILL